ncbi:MAG: hypothetical protein ACFFC7_29515 [Candidatus Hermodarchaeota archaeon]
MSDKEENNLVNKRDKTTPYVSINTTFTGDHAELIMKLEEEYQCTRPTALRLFLNKYTAGLLVTLNSSVKERIDRLIMNPIIKDQHGFHSVESFVEFAVNQTIARLSKSQGDLRDPIVQSILDRDELEVARQLLLESQDMDNYGGVSIEKLSKMSKLEAGYVRRIIDYFIANNWVTDTVIGHYLPIKRSL